jgi:hypothetical protein
LQRDGYDRHTGPPYTEHLGKKFLGQHEIRGIHRDRAYAAASGTSGNLTNNFHNTQRIAGLRKQNFIVTMEPGTETAVLFGEIAKVANRTSFYEGCLTHGADEDGDGEVID